MTKENTTSSEFAGETGRAAAVENKSNKRRDERLWSDVVTGEKNPIAQYSPLKPRHTSSPAKKQSEESTEAPVSVLHTHLVSPPPRTKVHPKQSKRQQHQTNVNTTDSSILNAATGISISSRDKPPPPSVSTSEIRSESVVSQQPDSSFSSGSVIANSVDHGFLTVTVDRLPGRSITAASRSVTSQAFDDANEKIVRNAGSDGAGSPNPGESTATRAGSASRGLVIGTPESGNVQPQPMDTVQFNRMDQGELVFLCDTAHIASVHSPGDAATAPETIEKVLHTKETA